MVKLRRIGHATFETPDLDRMVDYYTEVLGLVLVEREKDRAFLATQVGLLAIQLNRADTERGAMLSFEVAPHSDFGALGPRTGEGRHRKRIAQRFDPRHRAEC